MQNLYQHPRRVVAFDIVRRKQVADGCQPIRALGAFVVTLGRDNDVAFERHHHVYQATDYISPAVDMLSLVDARTDCLTAMAAPRIRDRIAFGNSMLERAQRRALPIVDDNRHRYAHFLHLRGPVIRAIGRQHGIDVAPPNADEGLRASRAVEQAQAVWLAWLTRILCDEPDRDGLVAAFQAYAKLDELRPIPF
ncbi:MAG: hypothetical protein WA954_00910 [Parerythrobacter sp.]